MGVVFLGGGTYRYSFPFRKGIDHIFHDSFDARVESVNDWGKTTLQNSTTSLLGNLFCVSLVQLCRARGEVFLPRFGEGQALRGFPMAWVCGEFTGRKPSTFSQRAAPATKDHHSPLACSMVYYGRIS